MLNLYYPILKKKIFKTIVLLYTIKTNIKLFSNYFQYKILTSNN